MKKSDHVLFTILWAACLIAFFVADSWLYELVAVCMGMIVSCVWFATDAICEAIKGEG